MTKAHPPVGGMVTRVEKNRFSLDGSQILFYVQRASTAGVRLIKLRALGINSTRTNTLANCIFPSEFSTATDLEYWGNLKLMSLGHLVKKTITKLSTQ